MFGRRSRKLEQVHARASVAIHCPPETVMDFLLDPRSAVLTGELTDRSLHLTDTPAREPGAQFVSLSRLDGLLVAEIEELVELDYPHRALSRNLSSPGEITVAYTCAPGTTGGTDYTQEVWMHPEPGRAAALQPLFEAETRRSVHRIKQVLESGEWTPPGG